MSIEEEIKIAMSRMSRDDLRCMAAAIKAVAEDKNEYICPLCGATVSVEPPQKCVCSRKVSATNDR